MLLSRAALDALLPPGPAWLPQDGGGLDQLLDGIAANWEEVRGFLAGLANIRDPLLTPFLDDLEREFGVLSPDDMDDATRRYRLYLAKTAGNGDGSRDFLQDRLQGAGFDVYVYDNSPAVDPASIIYTDPSSVFDGSHADFGESSFGARRGDLLVNGTVYYNQVRLPDNMLIPAAYWPLVFFVGGPATYDGEGRIISIAEAVVPVARKAELEQAILKLKPLHSWCGLVAAFTG